MIDEQVDYSALQAAQRVDAHMRLHYRVRLADLEQTDTPGYWQDDVACERIARAQAQGSLLPPEAPPKPVQEALVLP